MNHKCCSQSTKRAHYRKPEDCTKILKDGMELVILMTTRVKFFLHSHSDKVHHVNTCTFSFLTYKQKICIMHIETHTLYVQHIYVNKEG